MQEKEYRVNLGKHVVRMTFTKVPFHTKNPDTLRMMKGTLNKPSYPLSRP